jgi:2'-5' RNA ligase
MGIRSFLAFELPSEIKEVLTRVYGEVTRSSLDVRWVRTEGIHLTVVFMGDIEESDISPMGEQIGGVCSRYGPFTISLKSMGCFPNNRNPRVLWVGLEGDLERMSRFRDEIQRKLVPFGIREEKRDFRPHLTLGRFKKPGKKAAETEKLLLNYKGLTSPACSLKELIFFKSDLRSGGAVYTKMRSWALSGNQ